MNDPLNTIKNSQQWHAWHEEQRNRLRWRIEQATQADWNWPSTRRRCEILRLERELEQLNDQEFVVPCFSDDVLMCT